MAETFGTPTQVAKSFCESVITKLERIGFLEDDATMLTSAVGTQAALQTLIDDKDIFLVKAKIEADNSVEPVITEIAGEQVFAGNEGEYRYTLDVTANYAIWKQLWDGYNCFTGKTAFFFSKDNNISYIDDGTNAHGLPLGMVHVAKPPLFSNGADAARFKMYIAIDSNSLAGIDRSALTDYYINTVDPVAGS